MTGQLTIATDLQSKYTSESGPVFMTGVQALVRVLFDQMRRDRRIGLNTAVFACGYPGSPLGGFDRELAAQRELMRDLRVVHVPGHNEDLAATAVMGSQVSSTFEDATVDGVLGVWYGKAPGLDRSLDAIRHAQFAGTASSGGALAFVGDDTACKSSSIPSHTQLALQDLGIPTFEPGTVQEILDLGTHAVALSRASGLWSALRIVTPLADGSGTASIDPDRVVPVLCRTTWKGEDYRPTLTGKPINPWSPELERELFEAKLEVARTYVADNHLNYISVAGPRPWLGVAASGHTYYEAVAALEKLGLGVDELRDHGVRLLHVRCSNPLEPTVLREFATGLREIFVIEEKRPQLERQVKEALYGTPMRPVVVGKTDEAGAELLPRWGALDVDSIIGPLYSRLRGTLDSSRLIPPNPPRARLKLLDAARSPFYCSGCPHNISTRVPEGTAVGGGIGCHGLAIVMDPARVGNVVTTTHMGGEGAQWIGIEPFVETGHFLQNMGDGTFFHSGQLAVQAAVAARSNITFKILYNSAIGMTGGQETSFSNARPVPDMAAVLLRQGVTRVIITTDDLGKYKRVRLPDGSQVWDRTRLIEAQQVLAKETGVTVLIHDQECATELRRRRKRGLVEDPTTRVYINERVCEGCGDCGDKSNCLSVEPYETEFGRKTRINQSSCNKDYSCLDGDCPSFVTTVARSRRHKTRTERPNRADGGAKRRPQVPVELPSPVRVLVPDDVTIRMPGIGGTGVVTVNQILGTAALLDGLHVIGLDQTGVSQKAGPVVSDLRLSAAELSGTNKPSAGTVDLYLVFDLIVALVPGNLQGVSPERSHVVASTSKSPTGAMVSHVGETYPDIDMMLAALQAAVRPGSMQALDALRLAEGLFGDTTTANVLLLGVAYQSGLLPLSVEAIEGAIEMNGAAVEANKLAFQWGRAWVVDPDLLQAAMSTAPRRISPAAKRAHELVAVLNLPEQIAGDVQRLAEDLIDYQNPAYAQRFLRTVEIASRSERAVSADSTVFTDAVARSLHKLMAYKDEYEVARLLLDSAADTSMRETFGQDVKVYWHLHPPVLRALGLKRKLRLGRWFRPVLRSLRVARRLRGTPLDLCGYARLRRCERQLIEEFEEVVAELATSTGWPESLQEAVDLVRLPMEVRGYEHIKSANVERYRERLSAGLANIRASGDLVVDR